MIDEPGAITEVQARAATKCGRRFRASCPSQCQSGKSAKAKLPGWSEVPALLTQMSSRPRPPTAASMSRGTVSSAVMSPTSFAARRPRRSISETTSSSSCSRRAVTTTSAPASASPMAMPRPMPRPAPVTTATAPSSRNCAIRSESAGSVGVVVARPVRPVGLRCGIYAPLLIIGRMRRWRGSASGRQTARR